MRERACIVGTVLIIVAVLCAIGWVIVKNDELSGLGRTPRLGSLRAPHGRLVSVRAERMPEELPWSWRFARSFPRITCAMSIALALVAAGLASIGPAAEVGIALLDVMKSPAPALVIAAEALFRGREGIRLLSTYILALLGTMVAQVLVFLPVFFAVWGADSLGVQLPVKDIFDWSFLFLSFPGMALGAALVLARAGVHVKFLRRFEDGTENEIEVSTNSIAYGAYRSLLEGGDTRSGAS